MNRLIVVGNGFDLAHGMKTGYNDFILWYLKKAFSAYNKTGSYIDDLIEIKSGNLTLFKRELGNLTVSEYVDSFYLRNELDILLNTHTRSITFGWTSDRRERKPEVPFVVNVKSELLSSIIKCCSTINWVEIENLYYDELKKVLIEKNQSKQEDVRELNLTIEYIVDQLKIYLKELVIGDKIGYRKIFTDKVDISEIVGQSENTLKLNDSTNETLILNFNYTKTAEQYIDRKEMIYIHGELDNSSNPVIFGFGDELDADYIALELNKTKEIFNYIKSFWYFKTSNYHNLMRFIESNKFQARILGHSCGLSDRTLLNMIFEHKNCVSIKIFYHQTPNGGNNYTELTQEISRHFRNKQQMRMKIVPFDKSSPMPQHEKMISSQNPLSIGTTE
ncbi:hypothetical protein CPT03_03255 [Pedobacter ginsengisoli]|uniref:Bacteriophage abortive infection AbiH n=1 Tax=Pedobacter ginsengisoli TaxID=363852 RepID=A0A2D1U1R1_9SPHI|nr:AbiH family protein [Pedobacter ginsengisoli]ATP55548.1 hypothetical protein CPT03_03255 [Pedobacter ginsengisoli]